MIREPIASANAEGGPFFSWSLSTSGPITVAKPSALAWIQPGRSTTSTGAVRSLATQAGVLPDQWRRPPGTLTQLVHRVDRLDAGHLGALSHETGPHPDGEVPVDHSGSA